MAAGVRQENLSGPPGRFRNRRPLPAVGDPGQFEGRGFFPHPVFSGKEPGMRHFLVLQGLNQQADRVLLADETI